MANGNDCGLISGVRRYTASLATLLLVVAGIAPANSTPVRVEYSFSLGDLAGAFPVPATFTGLAYYDTDDTDVGHSRLYALYAHQVNLNGTTYSPSTNDFSGGPTPYNFVQFHDNDSSTFLNPDGLPRDGVSVGAEYFIPGTGATIGSIGISLEGTGDTFSGTSPFVPDPEAFDLLQVGYVSLYGQNCPTGCFRTANLDSVSFTVVPIPGLGWMLVPAFAFLASPRRRGGASSGIRR